MSEDCKRCRKIDLLINLAADLEEVDEKAVNLLRKVIDTDKYDEILEMASSSRSARFLLQVLLKVAKS